MGSAAGADAGRVPAVEHWRRVGEAALAGYDLPAPCLTPLRSGNNAVFRVATADGRAYALRVHRPGYRSVVETRSELAYLRALRRATGLAVPEPVPTRGGELVAIVAGDRGSEARHCDLLTWLPGRVRRPGQGLGPRSAHHLGQTLGRMHRFAAGFRPPEGFILPRWDAVGLFTEASPYRPGPLDALFTAEERALISTVEARVRALFARLDLEADQFGIIHADFILGNCQFHGRTPRVLDFDDCGWGYYLYDLCPLLGNLQDYPQYPTLRGAFLAGYRAERPLPRAHEAHLDLLIAARHAASCLWVAGCHRAGGLGPPPGPHVAYRLGEVRRYLAAAAAG